METLGSVIVFFAALFAVLARDSLPRGMAALSVSYALNVSEEGICLVMLILFLAYMTLLVRNRTKTKR